MVVRTRTRAILYPLVFYALAGIASAYFIDTAVNGERGLKAKVVYKKQIAALRETLAGLRGDHQAWDYRISLMRSEAIDGDLLDEQARLKLDYTDPRDLVIFADRH